MRQLALVCLALSLPLLTGCSREDPVTISFKWEKGQVLQQRMTMQTQSTSKFSGSDSPAGTKLDSTMSMIQDVRLRVLDAKPDGAATVEQTTTRNRMTMDGPMGAFTIDSSEPAPADTSTPAAAAIKSMKPMIDAYVGKPIKFDIDALGNIANVSGMKAVADKLAAAGPQGAAMKDAITDESVRATLQQYYHGWSTKPLAVGDTWDVQVEQFTPFMGTVKGSEKRRLKSISTIEGRRMATFVTEYTMPAQKLGNKGQTRPPGVPSFDFDMPESSGKGEHVFDLDWGRLHRSTTTMDMPVDLPMPGGGQMKMTTKLTMTLEAVNQ